MSTDNFLDKYIVHICTNDDTCIMCFTFKRRKEQNCKNETELNKLLALEKICKSNQSILCPQNDVRNPTKDQIKKQKCR